MPVWAREPGSKALVRRADDEVPATLTQIHILSSRSRDEHLEREHWSPLLPLHLGPRSPKQRSINLLIWRKAPIHRKGSDVDLTSLVDLASLSFNARVAIPKGEVLAVVAKDLLGELDGAVAEGRSASTLL